MSLIKIRGLTKIYRMGDTDVRALDNVHLDIDPGEFVAITGASGSGKSTMMHLLGCLDRPTAGRFIFDGRDVSELTDRELAIIRNKKIGFVFQTFNLINRTSAAENVGVPLFYARRTGTRSPAIRALERVGLAKRAHHKPNELSGGERQRVAIARAIVNDPLLILADEPTGNLDSRTGEQIMKIFHDLNAQGVTIVLVTHEPDVALQARRIIQMRDGRILADRPADEVRREMAGAPTGAALHLPGFEAQDSRPPTTEPIASAVAGVSIGGAGQFRRAASPTREMVAAGAIGSVAAPNSRRNAGVSAADSPLDPLVARALPRAGAPLEQARTDLPSVTEPDPSHDNSDLPPRRMRGSAAALRAGWIALALLGVRLTVGLLTTKPTAVTQSTAAISLLGALIAAIVAIRFAVGVRQRIASEPGNWIGGELAQRGRLLGWLTIALIIGSAIVFAVIQAPQSMPK